MSSKAGIGIAIATYNRREQLLQESPLLIKLFEPVRTANHS